MVSPRARLAAAASDLEEATDFLAKATASGRMDDALAGATPYLRLFSLALGSTLVAHGAAAANEPGRMELARFIVDNLLAETTMLKDRVVNGAPSLAALSAEFVA